MTAKFGLLIDAKTKGQNDIKRLGNSLQGVQGKAKNLGMAVRSAGLAFKALFAAAATAGFASVVKGAIDTADSFQKLEVRTGIAADTLMGYVEAGKLADVSQKQLEVGLKTLARTQVEAADGVKTYADTYAKLGIDVKNANGELKPTDQLLGEIADRFADLPDGPEKAAAALDLFGKSGVDMITMLNGGSKALAEFNYGLSDEFAQNAAFYNDEVTKLGREFNKFRLQLVDALLPALTQITQSFSTLFDEGQDLEPLFMAIAGSIRIVAAAVFATIKLVDLLVKNVMAGFEIVGSLLKGDFEAAFKIFQDRFLGVVDEAKKNVAELGRIVTGTSTAPEGYQRSTRGSGLQELPDQDKPSTALTEEEKQAKKLKDAYEGFKKSALEAQIVRNNAAKDAVQSIQDEINIGKMRLEQGDEFADKFQEVRDLVLDGVPFSEAFGLVEAKHNLAALREEADKAAEAQKTQAEELKGLYKQIGSTILNNIGSAIEGVIDGTKSLQESLADILKQIGSMLFSFGTNKALDVLFNAKGNVFAQNKIVPFAYGGIVDKPTLFPMANGAGLMGEAGPEAIMPLRRGRDGRLGVEASGGGIGGIVVNVDATGSAVEGDQQQSKQLGQAIGAAVQAEIIKQKMPGGLLN